MPDLKTNVLYYGDNLDILRKYIPDESIDLVYLDPPFNSKADYNILFRESSGAPSEAAAAGFYHNQFWKREYPRIQMITVEEVLKGKRPQMPPVKSPFAQAPLEREQAQQARL